MTALRTERNEHGREVEKGKVMICLLDNETLPDDLQVQLMNNDLTWEPHPDAMSGRWVLVTVPDGREQMIADMLHDSDKGILATRQPIINGKRQISASRRTM